MAYDATDFVVTETPAQVRDPKSITDPRERVAYLRDFLRELPPERFDIRWGYGEAGEAVYDDKKSPKALLRKCNTTACIGGWAAYIWHAHEPALAAIETASDLGLSDEQARKLMMPGDWRNANYTAAQAANVLDHYLATGEIDWSVA